MKTIELSGKLPGKRVMVLAGIHGNELCGVKAFDELLPQLTIERGSVVFVYANMEAIAQRKRFIDFNLNRCFLKKQPVEMEQSLEGGIARALMPLLDSADALLDLHATASPNSKSFVICDERWITDAAIFNSDLVTYNWDEFEQGSTDYYMNLQKKPAFCVECGYLEDERAVEIATSGIISFLQYMGNVSDIPKRKDQKVVKITGAYKNKSAAFRRVREFEDFELLLERTLIGFEGADEIWCEAGQMILFVRNQGNLNQECFLTAEAR